MSREELAKIAKKRGIDPRGKSDEQIRELISAHTQESQHRGQLAAPLPRTVFGQESDHPPMKVFCLDCGLEIEISGFVVGLAKELSNLLRKMGEKGLQCDEVARCDNCSVVFRKERERRAVAAMKHRQELRAAIRTSTERGQAYILRAPLWWRQDYEAEIAAELKMAKVLSTRKENTSFKVD